MRTKRIEELNLLPVLPETCNMNFAFSETLPYTKPITDRIIGIKGNTIEEAQNIINAIFENGNKVVIIASK